MSLTSRKPGAGPARLGPYNPPATSQAVSLLELLDGLRWLPLVDPLDVGPTVHLAGDASLLQGTAVAVIGSREVSDAGAERARRVARELALAGVVVSGLAQGVDTCALRAALDTGGRVVAVIGTPLERAYPHENRRLQERIYRKHLLVSPFAPGSSVEPGSFPQRNRLMAALSDASVIIEAAQHSGTRHQAEECARLGRWLLFARELVDTPGVTWPGDYLGRPRVGILSTPEDLFRALGEMGLP